MLAGCSSLKKGSSRMDSSSAKNETVDNKMPEIVVREEKVKTIEEQGPDTFYRYYVIIGSFRVLDNARSYKNDLKNDGFSAVILENENGLYRISVGAYNEETPARANIASIRSKYSKHEDVWLLIRKK
jgi:cell division protein FtsN